MFNPWGGYRVSGSWENHASYSLGGTDWPLAYGTALRAPAAGRLVNNGWAGSAGRRATLYFDVPVKRRTSASGTLMNRVYREHNCDMVAFVFQHARGYLGDGHYAEGALVGFSGASANGLEWGGDAHLHGHGLCAHGQRVDFMKFVGSSVAGGGYTVIEDEGFLMGLSDKQQDDLYQKIKAVYDATFMTDPTSRGSSGGVLKSLGNVEGMLANIGQRSQAVYDAVFTEEETSRGTPSGILGTLKVLLENLEGAAADIRSAVADADGSVGELGAVLAPKLEAILAAVESLDVPVPVGPSHVIDVAWPQQASSNGGVPFPFAEAKAAGVDAVIVKASGYNDTPLYVAGGYHEHVDGARAAGLPVGHYYVPGAGKSPEEQADWFVDNLHDYRAGDVVALDNEPLDGNAVFWLQDDCVRWHNRVHDRLATRLERHWQYFPADLTRNNGPWDKIEALGVKRWWAAYGPKPYPTGWEPREAPDLRGSLTGTDAHQYTSNFAVAGRSVDCSFSPLPITDLFG